MLLIFILLSIIIIIIIIIISIIIVIIIIIIFIIIILLILLSHGNASMSYVCILGLMSCMWLQAQECTQTQPASIVQRVKS